MKGFLNKIPHLKVIFIYGVFYLISFFLLEQRNGIIWNPTTILDKYIPFCEYFIVFYLFWFVYVALAVLYFEIYEPDRFKPLGLYLAIGMTVFIIVSFLFPNGISLRPELNNENIFQTLVSIIHVVDTSTNVFPSIHAYNSIVCGYALHYSKFFKGKNWLKVLNVFVVIMICASTVFLKQHAILDVIGAIVLSVIVIYFVNRNEKNARIA